MTTLVWDGKTLAADRCSWSGPARRRVRKVFRVEREGRTYLVAFCGSGSYAMQVLAWFRGEVERPDPRDYHKQEDLNNQCCLMIDEARRVWSMDASLRWVEYAERQFASGAGQEFAWGALEAGATAARAVEIAAKRSDYAGLGVDTVEF